MTKILNIEEVYKAHVFAAAKAHVVLPDGRERNYDLVTHTPAVVLVPVTDDGHILFVRQYRLGADKEVLELPAGMINSGEDPFPAAARELREETGYEAEDLRRIGGFYATPGYCNEYMNIYLAREMKWNPLPQDEDEFLSNLSLTIEEAYEAIDSGEIEDAKTIAALMLAQKYIRKH